MSFYTAVSKVLYYQQLCDYYSKIRAGSSLLYNVDQVIRPVKIIICLKTLFQLGVPTNTGKIVRDQEMSSNKKIKML